jgi:hypothetical protein
MLSDRGIAQAAELGRPHRWAAPEEMKAAAAPREPSMGPVFGMKGGPARRPADRRPATSRCRSGSLTPCGAPS